MGNPKVRCLTCENQENQQCKRVESKKEKRGFIRILPTNNWVDKKDIQKNSVHYHFYTNATMFCFCYLSDFPTDT